VTTRFIYATARFIRSGSSASAPFEGLQCVHLPASSAYDYVEHTHEMSRVNGATDALSIGPSAVYFLFSIIMHVSFLFTAYATSGTHMHIHVVTYITLVFWIKLKLIMSNFQTIQKPGIMHFSVRDFAVALKPSEPF
jgi:hypothetical protein